MKNFTRLFEISFLCILSCIYSNKAIAQPGNMSVNTDFNATYANQSMSAIGVGTNNTVYTFRASANATTSSGTKFYQFNADSYYNTWNLNTPTYNATSTATFNAGSGYNGGIKMGATTSGYYYTFNIRKGTSYANQTMAILQTAYSPQSINSYTAVGTVYGGQTASVPVTMSGALNAAEYLYVAYSTDAFATSANSGIVASGALNGSFVGTAIIPAYPSGTVVTYYPFTSTSSTAPTFTDMPLLTLNMRNGTAQNTTAAYSYYTVQAWQFNGTTNTSWNVATNWNANSIPPTNSDMGAVTINNNVTLNQDALVSSLTINSTFTLTGSDGSARNLSVSAGGTITNNSSTSGGYSSTSTSTVTFSSAGTINGSNAITFNHLTLTTGTLTLTTVPTINGTFTLSGGNVSAAPIYGNSSLLKYNTGGTYGRNNEWNGTTGTVGTTAGLPQSVQISNSTTLNYPNGNSSPARTLAGYLTVDAGSGFYMDYSSPSTSTGALTVGGNVSINGGFSLGNISGGDLNVGGNFTVASAAIANGINFNGRALSCNGTGTQIVTNTSGGNFNLSGSSSAAYFIVNNTGGSVQLSSSPATSVTVTQTSNSPLQLLSTGTLDLNGQTFTLSGVGGSIQVTGGSRSITSSIANGTFSVTGTASNTNKTVTSSSSGLLSFGANVNVLLANGGVDFGSSLTTVSGILQVNGNGYVATNPPTYGSGSTLIYNNGGTFGVANEWTAGATSGSGVPANVQIGNGATSSALSLGNAAYTMTGILTFSNNTGAALTMNASGGTLNIRGNWVNNTTNSANFTKGGGTVVFNGSSAQTIGGNNTNASGYAFNSLTISNSTGVTLNRPITVSGTLTLTNGIVTTSGTNTLSVTNTANTAVAATTSFSTFTFINGPLTWSLPNSSSSNYIFPVGVGTTYLPFAINSPTGTSAVVTVQAYAADINSSATYGSNLTGISHTEYWLASNSGTFSSGKVLLGSASIGSNTAVAYSTSTSSLASLGGTIGNTLISSNTITANFSSPSLATPTYFVVAVSAAPVITSFSASPGSGTSGYVSSTVTIAGTNMNSATSVTVGGTPVTIVSNTATSITFTTTSGMSGVVTVTNAIGSGTSGSSYADLGYISTASTDWSNATTWLGGSVPAASANVTIANVVTVTGSVTNAVNTLVINSGSSFTFSSSGALTATTVTNNGTLAMSAGTLTIASGGTLTNNTSGTSFSGGTVSFSSTGTVNGSNAITFNNLLSISGVVNLNTAPTINGTLTINTLGGIGVNAPYYGTSSTLFYNASTTTGSPYSRTYEWIAGTTSSSSAGYPNNVTIGSSSVGCVLNVNNVTALQMGGILTIGASSGSSSSLQMNEATTPYPLTVVGNVIVNATGTLLLGNLVSSYAGDLYAKANFTNNGTFNNNSRAVFFNGSSSQTISGSALNASSGTSNNFSYLFINNTSASVSLGSNIAVSSTLNISSGATLSDGGNTLSVSGASVVNNGTHTSTGSGEIKLTGSSVGISGTGTFQNVEISLTSNSNIATISSSFSISGNLTVTQGRVQPSGSGRVITMNGATQVITVASSNGFIYGTDNYPNDLSLIVNSGSTTTCTGTTTTSNDDGNKFLNITVNGKLILASGILCKYGAFNVAGTLQINANGYVQSTSGVAASYSSGNLIYNNGGSYNATDFEWPTSNAPTNVILQNTSPSATNVKLNDSKTISGILTLSSSSNYLGLNGQTLTLNGAVSGSGTISSTATSSLVIAGTAGTLNFTIGSNTIQNLTLNSNATSTLGSQLNITAGASSGVVTIGNSATLTTGGNLVIKSDANGTARIATSAGSISGNVTVERYISSKTVRKFSFIGSAVSGVTISNSWQQNIYITGSGTGGTVCSTVNTNGFDATTTNTPSMYTYAAIKSNGSHYVSVPNTNSTNLTPGYGYAINIRGNRNSSTVTCANQLETSSPTAPEAVTLSATGTVTIGDKAVSLNDTTIHYYTLLANPYPCPISFTSFQGSNGVAIYNNMWTFSPVGNGNYTTYSAGTIANGASGYDDTYGDYIASGQAFFVQATQAGSGSTVSFHESNKTTGIPPNTNYFGAVNNQLIRLGLYSATNARLDEIVVRYNNNNVSKIYSSALDATSFSSGNQTLASLKGSTLLAIATRPINGLPDTVGILAKSKTAGSFLLNASSIIGFGTGDTILLKDNYLDSTQNLMTNPIYSFNVTSDTASIGQNRFKLLVSGTNTLPVTFTGVSALLNNASVYVKWTVASEHNINSYKIERSVDGKSFIEVGTVKANGRNAYTFTDKQLPTASTIYYRVASLGQDGKIIYSSVVSVKTSTVYTKLSIYPNPVHDKVNITLNTVSTGTYNVRVVTVAGKVVYEKEKVSVASTTLSIDVSSFAGGVYMSELTDEKGNKLIDKFIKE